ncbi:endonuclease/exonuclease/phosphatase family protein [Actinacidiphila alni]|uniref:endonuclease/exonuclease/phosphatase family protein n=1 Tax=Actinacidiphila alni TaxID=380248 RepID=UPI0033CEA9C6
MPPQPAAASTGSTLTLASPAAPRAGDRLTFDWTTDRPSAKNWIAVYGPGTSPSSGTYWVWAYISAGTSGTTTVDTSTLAGGPYTAYLLHDDGQEILARAAPVTFTAAGSGDSVVLVSPTAPREGQKLTFTWSTGTPKAKNWIGIYDADRRPGTGASIVWAYAAAASGTLTLDTSGLTGGPYTAYLLYDDRYAILAKTEPFGFAAVQPPHEAVDAVIAPATVGDEISVPLGRLWIRPEGNRPGAPAYRRVSGDSWLSVSSDGTVTGRAPATASSKPGRIVTAVEDSGNALDTVTVEVPVRAVRDDLVLKVASLNLWDAGTHVDGPLEKQARVVLTQNLDIVALQESGAGAATALGQALGWSAHQGAYGLGVVSRHPLDDVTEATAELPALSATVRLPGGRTVRLWVAQLDEAGYGPYGVAAGLDAAGLVAAERTTVRLQQAQRLAAAMKRDLAAATPVILAAGLASPSHLDWTARTAAAHGGVGAVAWPVTEALQKAGLTDAFREANPDPVKAPGITWSPVRPVHDGGGAEPRDRIDQVQYAGRLEVVEAHSLITGRPQPVPATGANGWPSDHAAAVVTFSLRMR